MIFLALLVAAAWTNAIRCNLVLQGANKVEMELDLVSGRVVPPTVPGVLTHITLLDGPTASSRPDQCDGQALVRLDFSGSYKKAKIELFYGREPRLWTATIADSPKSYGFGANHEYSSNCAEAQVFNGQLRLYSNLLPGFLRESMDGHSLMRVTDKAVEMGANMTFELSDGSVSWKTHFPNTSEVLKDSIRNCPFLFTLSGQIPAFGPPRDSYIYAGFNRVPLGSFHSGSGLCKVRITFKREQGKGKHHPLGKHCERVFFTHIADLVDMIMSVCCVFTVIWITGKSLTLVFTLQSVSWSRHQRNPRCYR